MTTQSHTPGPWSVYIEVPGSPPRIVAGALRNDIGGCTYKADARLMAAAPDMARVLAELLGALETDAMDDKSNVYRSAMIDARAALAKAGL